MADNRVLTLAHEPLDVAVSRVLRNTYLLLSMTLAFSTVTAGVSIAIGMPYLGLWTLLPFFVLLWLVHKFAARPVGIALVFAFTGWLGFSAGPIIGIFLAYNPGALLMALGGTAAVFFAASGYVLLTRRNMSFMTGFLMTGVLVAFVAGIVAFLFELSALALVVSAMFAVLSSLLIMWQTSAIIHGGERNYILATVMLYVSIYNLFMSLLSLIGFADE